MQELDANRADSSQRVVDLAVDLAQDGAPEAAVHRAVKELGHLDILVCNHARSGGDGALGDLTAEMLDAHWIVNASVTSSRAQPRPPNSGGTSV